MAYLWRDLGNKTSRPEYHVYRSIRHFGSLNGLRFFCIFAVLWHHAPIWTSMQDAPVLLQRGFLGVDFFFVLSGFLITTLLLREEDQNGRFSLKGFYWRRCLRIVPVYFLVVTLLAVYFIGVKGQSEYLELLSFYYLFLSNLLIGDIPILAPTWSLSVEEQYYLVWPLLLLATPRRFILPVLAVLIMLNVVAVTGGCASWGSDLSKPVLWFLRCSRRPMPRFSSGLPLRLFCIKRRGLRS
ncbi:MAG: acyltransferase [Desulforhopalus sp.]|nr:acyltransferase [Desulforhopalus sp.]